MRGLHFERLEGRELLHGETISTPFDTVPIWGDDGVVQTTGGWTALGGDVRIPVGVTVTVDDLDATARNVLVEGTLRFDPSVDTRLLAETILVMPTGRLEIKPNAGVNSEIVIDDTPLDLANDPEQYGHGVLVFGAVDIQGQDKTDFVRLAAEPRAGQTTLTLSAPAIGWKVGDVLVLPDTRQLIHADGFNYRDRNGQTVFSNNANPEDERLTIAGISADGLTVTLAAPLRHDHFGARDADGLLRFLPHVANLTRSVVIRSENPAGVRGHFLATDDAQVEIENAAFVEMGRTTVDLMGPANHIGRYAIHLHHLDNTAPFLANGERFLVSGNAIDGSPKWGIAVHDTHYGRVVDNVVYNADGAGIVQEDGSETGNEFLYNFVVRNDGDGDRIDERRNISESEVGQEGASYWMRSWNETVFIGNVGSQTRTTGFVVLANIVSNHIPIAPGTADVILSRRGVDLANLSPALFQDNEFYGAMQMGMNPWYQKNNFTVKNFVAWNVSHIGFANQYSGSPITVDGFTVLFDPSRVPAKDDYAFIGLQSQSDMLVSDVEVSGAKVGISHNPGVTVKKSNSYSRFEGLRLDNQVDFVTFGGLRNAGYSRRTDILDAAFSGDVGLLLHFDPYRHRGTVFGREEVYVQFAGESKLYRAWYDAQRADYVVPQSKFKANGKRILEGAPREGMTNDEVFAEIGKAIGGEIMYRSAIQLAGNQAWFSLVK